MPPAELEPTMPASEWPQKHALDRVATEIGVSNFVMRSVLNFVTSAIF